MQFDYLFINGKLNTPPPMNFGVVDNVKKDNIEFPSYPPVHPPPTNCKWSSFRLALRDMFMEQQKKNFGCYVLQLCFNTLYNVNILSVLCLPSSRHSLILMRFLLLFMYLGPIQKDSFFRCIIKKMKNDKSKNNK